MENETQDQNLNNPNLASQGQALQNQSTEFKGSTPNASSNWIKFGIIAVILLVLLSSAYILGKNNSSKQSPTPLGSPKPTAQTADPTADWKTYTNSDLGFSFKYPPDSKLKVNCHDCGTSDIDISFPNDTYTLIQIGSTSNYDRDKPTVKDIVDSLIYVRKFSTDPYTQQIRSPITLDGVEGEKLFSEEKIGDFIRDDIEIYVIKDKKLYSLDFRFEAKNKQKMSTLADQILSTFKFTDSNTSVQDSTKVVTDFYTAYIGCWQKNYEDSRAGKESTENCDKYKNDAVLSKILVAKISNNKIFDQLLCAQNFPLKYKIDQTKTTGNTSATIVHTYYGSTDNPITVSLIKENNNWLINNIVCKN